MGSAERHATLQGNNVEDILSKWWAFFLSITQSLLFLFFSFEFFPPKTKEGVENWLNMHELHVSFPSQPNSTRYVANIPFKLFQNIEEENQTDSMVPTVSMYSIVELPLNVDMQRNIPTNTHCIKKKPEKPNG